MPFPRLQQTWMTMNLFDGTKIGKFTLEEYKAIEVASTFLLPDIPHIWA